MAKPVTPASEADAVASAKPHPHRVRMFAFEQATILKASGAYGHSVFELATQIENHVLGVKAPAAAPAKAHKVEVLTPMPEGEGGDNT